MERDVTSAEMLSRLNQFIKEREEEGAEGNNTTNWGLVKFREGVIEDEISTEEEEILKDFDPKGRKPSATGGRVQAANGGLASILKL